ncbi:MAG TPA: hypothetical protein PKL08_01905 [Thermoanaerobaculaceae bacterium]|nr:hypothetical protein [Thermoanaerobaculaceae bacterium]
MRGESLPSPWAWRIGSLGPQAAFFPEKGEFEADVEGTPEPV